MNRSFEIVKELKAARLRQADLKNQIAATEALIARRELALMPAEGSWPGKNESERNAARDRAFAADGDWIEMNGHLIRRRIDMVAASIDAEALREEFEAIQWTIRDNTNELLGGRSAYTFLVDQIQDKVSDKIKEAIAQDESELMNPAPVQFPPVSIRLAPSDSGGYLPAGTHTVTVLPVDYTIFHEFDGAEVYGRTSKENIQDNSCEFMTKEGGIVLAKWDTQQYAVAYCLYIDGQFVDTTFAANYQINALPSDPNFAPADPEDDSDDIPF